MSYPMFSVIIPVFNKEKSIFKTIQSVLSQNLKDFELIIIDDGSTDKSLSIITGFEDDRIRFYTKSNGGVSEARNFGAKKSLSSNLLFLDADDILKPNCLQVFLGLLKDYPGAKVYTANFTVNKKDGPEYIFCSGKGRYLVKNPYKALWNEEIFPRMGSTVIKKSAFFEVGAFRPKCSLYEDLDLILKLFRNNLVIYSEQVVLKYNLEFNELSKNIGSLKQEFSWHIKTENSANIYHKLILLDQLHRSLRKRLSINDNPSIQVLRTKLNLANYFILNTGKICRKISKFKQGYLKV